MKTLLAILSIASASALLLGQTPGRDSANPPMRNPLVDRIERLSKTFPPEMPAGTNYRAGITPARTNCVYPSPATRSLSIKPCPANPHKLHVVPPFKNVVPKTKP